MNKSSSLLDINTGVPQGSVLGPVLFNIYVNDIVRVSENVEFSVYADDTSLFLQSDDVSNLSILAHDALEKLQKRSEVNSLVINAAKTKAVLFKPTNKKIYSSLDLHLGDKEIGIVQDVKILGVTFSEDLNCDLHVYDVAKKLARARGVLSKFQDIVSPKGKLLIYNALFHSHINYCTLVCENTTQKKKLKLIRLQKKAIRHIAGVPYDAHTSTLFTTYNVLQVEQLYNFNLFAKYKHGLKSKTNFLTLCQLKESPATPYNIGKRDTWQIPFSRKNYGLKSLKHIMPNFLNRLNNQGIQPRPDTLTNKQWKEYLISNPRESGNMIN